MSENGKESGRHFHDSITVRSSVDKKLTELKNQHGIDEDYWGRHRMPRDWLQPNTNDLIPSGTMLTKAPSQEHRTPTESEHYGSSEGLSAFVLLLSVSLYSVQPSLHTTLRILPGCSTTLIPDYSYPFYTPLLYTATWNSIDSFIPFHFYKRRTVTSLL
jgi:hypothetical protein